MKEYNFNEFLRSKNIFILFATAPTGLGHIRVTEALKEELGSDIQTETIGIMNPTSQFLHRLMSKYFVTRILMEFFQSNPIGESVVSWIYKKKLRTRTKAVRIYLDGIIRNQFSVISSQISDGQILDSRSDKLIPDNLNSENRKLKTDIPIILIVATHFGLAHQIAACKKRVEKESGVQLVLAVVVTDDSPQMMWAVTQADYIFVPSAFCAKGIRKHLGTEIGSTKIIVSAYSVSKSFTEPLSKSAFEKRLDQTNPTPGEKLRVLIPISGAAVQLSYFQNVITRMRNLKDVNFTIVSRDSSYTRNFLSWAGLQQNVIVEKSKSDHEVVDLYSHNLSEHVFSVEITKPSEQAFKALLNPKMKGGVVLLFSRPVGRQEYDNVHFLERHNLLPNRKDMLRLNALWYLNQKYVVDEKLLQRAKTWRGILLPRNGTDAANAILSLYETGILYAMTQFNQSDESIELRSDGARNLWTKLATELQH